MLRINLPFTNSHLPIKDHLSFNKWLMVSNLANDKWKMMVAYKGGF